MKNIKVILSLTIIAGIFFISYNLYAAEVSGKTVDLLEVVGGREGNVDKAGAIALVKAGKPLAFKTSDGKLYLVFNTDGSVADKNLAKNADNEYKIVGKIHNKNGFQYIIADKFE